MHWQLLAGLQAMGWGARGGEGGLLERAHLRVSAHKALPTHLDLSHDNFGASGLRS